MSETPGERFLLAEYQAVQEAFQRNEEMGERRVNLLLTFVGAVLAALTAGFIGEDRKTAAAASIAGLAALLLFGLSTLARIIRRNLKSTEYLRAAAAIRAYFAQASPEVTSHLTFGTTPAKLWRRRVWCELFSLRVGGAADNVELVNGLVAAGLGGAVALYFTERVGVLAPVIAGSFCAALFVQFVWVKRDYNREVDRNREKGAEIMFDEDDVTCWWRRFRRRLASR